MMKRIALAAVAALVASGVAHAGITGSTVDSNATLSGAVSVTGPAQRLLLVGPVERVDAAAGTFTLLGQSVHVRGASLPRVGVSVAVTGQLLSNGSIIASRVSLSSRYIPGASGVLVTGLVAAVDPSTARVRVGGLWLDYASLLAIEPTLSLAVGSVVQFAGTQPSRGGLVLVGWVSGPGVQGITGSTTQGITGSTVQGITGSTTQGITGSTTQGITGSTTQGITGSTAQ